LRRKGIEALEEGGYLLKGPYNSDIINVSRDGKIAEAVRRRLKNWLQTEAEQQCAEDTALPRSALGDETLNQPLTTKEMKRGRDAIAQIGNAPQ
jgi:hypothetical protein